MAKLWNLNQPKMVTEPPGPETKRILAAAGLPPDFATPIIKSAEGVWIEDLDGNVIMDFISGRCTVNVGHRHPRLVQVLHHQADLVTHGLTEDRLLLEKELARITPGKKDKRAVYAHSGSDANDAAIKLARWSSGKPYIVCFAGAYHGVTYGALSVSSYIPEMVKHFGPNLPGIYNMPYPYCFRCPFGYGGCDECGLSCLNYIKNYAFKSYLPPVEVAAVLVEPVAGDAGWHVPPKEWMKGLKEICVDNGILLISEEVQTGFGRMGEWFGMTHFGVVPDIIVMGKAMAGGAAPMSGVVAESSLFSKGKDRFSHGHTMGGHPVGVATTLENIKIIEDENLVEECKKKGDYLKRRLIEIWEDSSIIGDVRGVGLLIGVEIVKSKRAPKMPPAPDYADEICRRAYKKGLWTIRMGAYGTGVLRVAPPLIISQKQLDTAVGILEKSIKETEDSHR